ncbi:MAG: PDZ domain-containing protein, partial [Gemmatimonadetes bacterium]|nr:PDZ domain-containing protein [Gemmatimonadota bacterium]NIQ59958.1 PDZ domain-containing protein [Gemmatimonadota bacterium]NIU80164.1 PDZ domain-containing protein [Gammaproteobacteria bacterium]NIX48561.1 PDZ domain-containing protein [Gemmatimonadota bacterium]NIY13005.1 PDZ domain-containing protein [Gemmatimonadota bacterium]
GRSRRVRVARVARPSPGAEAGLREGAEIVSVNGDPIRTPLDWEAALLEARPGEPLEVGTE